MVTTNSALFLFYLFLQCFVFSINGSGCLDLMCERKLRRLSFNSVMATNVQVVFRVRNAIHCGSHCVAEGCQAVNYKHLGAGNQTTLCEVSALGDHSKTLTFIPRPGWSSFVLTTKQQVERVDTSTTAVNSVAEINTISSTPQWVATAPVFVDTNPEFCDIDAAFILGTQICLTSGEAVYLYSDVSQLASGPIRSTGISNVFPDSTFPVDAIYEDTNGEYVFTIRGELITCYVVQSDSSLKKMSETSQISFWGRNYEGISAVFSQLGETVVLLGSHVTTTSTSKTWSYGSNSNDNVLLSTNGKSAPSNVNAACALDSLQALFFDNNNAHSFMKTTETGKGTWESLGSVKCR